MSQQNLDSSCVVYDGCIPQSEYEKSDRFPTFYEAKGVPQIGIGLFFGQGKRMHVISIFKGDSSSSIHTFNTSTLL